VKTKLLAELLCGVLLAGTAFVSESGAATLVVANSNDSGSGSLRQAISDASPGDEIRFDPALAGTPVVLTTGELLIDRDLTITGLGRDWTILDGNAASRVFRIAEGAMVKLSALTIENGLESRTVPDDPIERQVGEGGGIYNAGSLALEDCSIKHNTVGKTRPGCPPGSICDPAPAMSVRGGGVFNRGFLEIKRCDVEANQAIADPGFGGGIDNAGEIVLDEASVSGNGGFLDRGHGMQGGGLYNEASGTARLVDCAVSGNYVSQGIANVGDLAVLRTTFAGNSNWRGGALVNRPGGKAVVTESTLVGNLGGPGALAGGVGNFGDFTLIRSSVIGNLSARVPSAGGIQNFVTFPENIPGTLTILNSTISGNDCDSGSGLVNAGNARIDASTIAGNTFRGSSCSGPGGIASGGGTILRNVVIAGNSCESFGDCAGDLISSGHNILGDDRGCRLIANAGDDQIGVDWETVMESAVLFGNRVPLYTDNGGPTPTIALLPDSPAIDAIPLSACQDGDGNPILTDQRGVSRPQGAACDTGAFEFSEPRGAGFWAHQCSDKGFKQVGAAELETLFGKISDTSSVFPELASATCEFLQPTAPQSDVRVRAQQALLDLWLNLDSGRLTRGRPIDLSGLTNATTVQDALSQIELSVCDPLASRSDLGNAKAIADALNGTGDDMELGVQESAVTLLPGATRTVLLGVVNMSAGNRNYSLAASGPWPVKLSVTRINALQPGQVAEIAATVTAPLDSRATMAQIRVNATDLLSQVTLSRDVTITFKLAGSPAAPPSAERPRQLN
jgi:hypothetical protein